MKVLIVDDEEHVREAIELSIDWQQYGITQRLMAGDGMEAMKLMREHRPAVIFCDMSMPRMDGTELLQRLREENGDVQVIVISGHDDFRYTQAAIRAWGVDYLLKPFRKSDLERALAKAVSVWEEKQSSRSGRRETAYRMKQVDALLEEQRLAAYLKGEIPYHEGIRSLLNSLGRLEEGVRITLILPRNRTEIVNRRFDGDAELFVFAVHNIAQEVLTSCGAYSFCRLDSHQWVLLMSEGTRSLPASGSHITIRALSDAWRRTLGLTVFTGSAEEEALVEHLPRALSEARISLLNSPVLDSGAVPAERSPVLRLSDQQVLLEAALHSGNKAYAAELIGSFVRSIRERGSLTLKELQAYTMEGNLLLDHASRLHHGGQSRADLQLPLWICDLEEWERLQLQQWWRLMEESGSESTGTRSVESMRDYMNQHYQEDISLSSLSERFHFSPQYISKKFKEMYNTTVVTYLTELRMEKAMSLLMHTGMPVSEISERLGFADENYFGKVFKKHTGCSPVQYRKQGQQKGAVT
ncbi:response regulator transcription factor [Paenibacillus lemnae]|uniref:Response regulator n=1 Tax=Paenibacillus lemnae TaxID=1330551 RepID=A0A848M276_PAELE|nr:response regulator [Paenibacillus lemnae]NMO94361.1 response regulator [Paenibacillus lemnae]